MRTLEEHIVRAAFSILDGKPVKESDYAAFVEKNKEIIQEFEEDVRRKRNEEIQNQKACRLRSRDRQVGEEG